MCYVVDGLLSRANKEFPLLARKVNCLLVCPPPPLKKGIVRNRQREAERERDTDRDRQTDRQTKEGRDSQTEREGETDSDRERQIARHRERETDRQLIANKFFSVFMSSVLHACAMDDIL